MHQAYPYCTSLWCLRIEKHHPVPPGSVGYLNITNTVHQANPYFTSLYCPRIEKHHSVPSGAVLVSNSTTQYHLALSAYKTGFTLHIIMGCTSVMYYSHIHNVLTKDYLLCEPVSLLVAIVTNSDAVSLNL